NASNASIAKLGDLSLYTLAQASIMAKETLEREAREEILESIRSSSPAVRDTVHEFCSVMMEIAWANSLFLRLALLVARRYHDIAHKFREKLSFPFPTYDAYRFFERMATV
ncbi:MAG: hypothetical protein Q8N47_05230, partial [Bryobacterales bacterium]|nr:hypothetical protein [Bryobacterales bacterium]